jgi:hypothetical protein
MKLDLSKLQWDLTEGINAHNSIGMTDEELCSFSKRINDTISEGLESDDLNTLIAKRIIDESSAKEIQLMLATHVRDLIDIHLNFHQNEIEQLNSNPILADLLNNWNSYEA